MGNMFLNLIYERFLLALRQKFAIHSRFCLRATENFWWVILKSELLVMMFMVMLLLNLLRLVVLKKCFGYHIILSLEAINLIQLQTPIIYHFQMEFKIKLLTTITMAFRTLQKIYLWRKENLSIRNSQNEQPDNQILSLFQKNEKQHLKLVLIRQWRRKLSIKHRKLWMVFLVDLVDDLV